LGEVALMISGFNLDPILVPTTPMSSP